MPPPRKRQRAASTCVFPREVLAMIASHLDAEDRDAFASAADECYVATIDAESTMPFWKQRLAARAGPLVRRGGGRWRPEGEWAVRRVAPSPDARWFAVERAPASLAIQPEALLRIDPSGAVDTLPAAVLARMELRPRLSGLWVADDGEVRFQAAPFNAAADEPGSIVSWPVGAPPRILLDLAEHANAIMAEAQSFHSRPAHRINARCTSVLFTITDAPNATNNADAMANGAALLVVNVGDGTARRIELAPAGSPLASINTQMIVPFADGWLIACSEEREVFVGPDGQTMPIAGRALRDRSRVSYLAGRVCKYARAEGDSKDELGFFRVSHDGRASEVEPPPRVLALYGPTSSTIVAWAAAARGPAVAVTIPTMQSGFRIVEVPPASAWLDCL
eukprot:tig00020539_g10411.t1